MTERQKPQRKCLGEKNKKGHGRGQGGGNTPAKKGKGVLCQEKCANLMQLKQIFKETL